MEEDIKKKEDELKELEAKKEGESSTPLIEEAKKVNEERKEILDREEKLQTRREKLHADEMVAGKGKMQEGIKEETDKEYSKRIMRGE